MRPTPFLDKPLLPLYATEVVVSSTPEEVLLDFFSGIKPPTSHLARIVISRPHLARLQRLLEQVLSTPTPPLDQQVLTDN